jgi:hypothetical protein
LHVWAILLRKLTRTSFLVSLPAVARSLNARFAGIESELHRCAGACEAPRAAIKRGRSGAAPHRKEAKTDGLIRSGLFLITLALIEGDHHSWSERYVPAALAEAFVTPRCSSSSNNSASGRYSNSPFLQADLPRREGGAAAFSGGIADLHPDLPANCGRRPERRGAPR